MFFCPKSEILWNPPNRNLVLNSQLYFPWALYWLIVKVNMTVINNSEFYYVHSQTLFSFLFFLQQKTSSPKIANLSLWRFIVNKNNQLLYEDNISASPSWACRLSPAAIVRDFSQQTLLICINRSTVCLFSVVTSEFPTVCWLSLYYSMFSLSKVNWPIWQMNSRFSFWNPCSHQLS